jgi:hypothetical protein
VSVLAASPVAADHVIGSATTCNNSVGEGGGQGVICEVTIVNTVTPSGGSAVVTIHECLGSAGAPLEGVCSTTTQSLTAPVTSINQCNGSVVGGGSKLLCSIVITNNFTAGVAPGAITLTVNQCVGSGGAGNVKFACDPYPATTDGAAIIQCNGTATGDGASLTCTASGTMASALAVTIDQCNGSAVGGGALVVCSASITNNAVPLATPTPVATTPVAAVGIPTAEPTATPPLTSTDGSGSGNNSTPLMPLMILLALSGLGLTTILVQRQRIHL